MIFFDDIDDQEQEAWKLLAERIPELTNADWSEPSGVLPPGLQLNHVLAVRALRNCRPDKDVFLTSDQLYEMATQDLVTCEMKGELDIPAVGGVYILLSLVGEQTIKVGESGDLRYRLGRQHLRYGQGQAFSDLKGFITSRQDDWPQVLRSDEIVCLAFPLPEAEERERRAIEEGLRTMLHPVMDR